MATMALQSGFTVALTLIVIVTLELVRIMRELSYKLETNSEVETLDYNLQFPIIERLVTRTPVNDFVARQSRFMPIFFLTEYLIASSIAIITYNFKILGPNSNPPAFVAVGSGLLVFIWLFLPILVIDKYESVINQGIRPISLNVHMFGTIALLGGLVYYFNSLFFTRENLWQVSTEAGIPLIGFLLLMATYIAKLELFTSMLDVELKETRNRRASESGNLSRNS